MIVYLNLVDSFDSAFSNALVKFTPICAPFNTGSSLSAANAKSQKTDDNGNLTASLVPGQYHVLISSKLKTNYTNNCPNTNSYSPPNTDFLINVPSTGSSYNINQLIIINPALTPVLFLPLSSSNALYAFNTSSGVSTVYNAISASYAGTSSLLLGSIQSASYALTASYVVTSSVTNQIQILTSASYSSLTPNQNATTLYIINN